MISTMADRVLSLVDKDDENDEEKDGDGDEIVWQAASRALLAGQ